MARAGINWARGLDELGTGLLRQADIGGRAYEGAMVKEAETRAANRAFAAEERAATRAYDKEMRADTRAKDLFAAESTRWVEQQGILQEYSIENLERRAELQEESDLKKFGRESAFTLKTWRMERYAAIRDLESKAKTERALLDIKNNVSRAESADKKVTSILTALGAAMKEGETAETERLSKELEMAELQATEAWARIPGVDPLTTRQLTDFKKFSIIGGEIVEAISLDSGLGQKVFRQAITSIKQGKGSSGYDAAYEAVSRTIDRIIEENPTFRNYRGAKKRDLKKHIIETLLPNVNLGEAAAGGEPVVDEGNGNLGTSLRGDPLDDLAVDITVEDIGSYRRAKAALDARGARPGRLQSPEQKELNRTKRRDPEYLLPLLRAEKAKIDKIDARTPGGAHWLQDRLGRINELISKFEAMVGNEQAALPPAIPQKFDTNQSVVGVGGPASGMLSQGPGMIGAADMFGTDRMPMDAPSVNARYTA